MKGDHWCCCGVSPPTPQGLLLLHGVRALGLPETPKLGQRGSGERTKLLLDMWLVAGLTPQSLSQQAVAWGPVVTC